ncbi:MAG: hypothetical protein QGH39_10955, partial [Candidatus Thermoplasmatota archaeon]|nr:hypothetical protein [Candidatus Thermoplasmatota archaeon]
LVLGVYELAKMAAFRTPPFASGPRQGTTKYTWMRKDSDAGRRGRFPKHLPLTDICAFRP